MKISEIKQMAQSKISPKSFFMNNINEVVNFKNSIINKRDSINIYIEDDEVITEEDLSGLLTLYLGNKLLEWDLEYISRVIEMSDNNSENVEQIAFYLSDPFLGIEITPDNIKNLLNSILQESKPNTSRLSKNNTRGNYRSITDTI